jgi:hypothetical protein
MSRPTAFLAAVAVLASGCTTVSLGPTMTPEVVKKVQVENFPRTVEAERVYPLPPGMPGQPPGRWMPLAGTTPTGIVVRDGSQEVTVDSREIRSLKINDHAAGARIGAGVGLVLAAAYLVGVAVTYQPCRDCFFDFGKADLPIALAVNGVLVALPLVAISTGVGALIGSPKSYVLQP